MTTSAGRDSTGSSGREIGFVTAIALVMGNMIGSGVFLLPASLAPYGGIGLVGWLVSAAGSVMIALAFAHLARRAPAAGGPYAYTRMAFGDLAGFLMAWLYWISAWSGIAAIAVAFAGYAGSFFPSIASSSAGGAMLAIAALWLLVGVNVMGVRQAGRVQVVTTVLKVLPLLMIMVAGAFAFNADHFTIPHPGAKAIGKDVFATVTLTLWAFMGMEAATVPADHVRDAERTIPRATIVGTLLTAVIYIASSAAIMGIVAPSALATSTAPFADGTRAVFGNGTATMVAIGAAIAAFGALNGWTLVVGQIPLAAARDGLFPPVFARLSTRGTPAAAFVIAGALATILIAANYTRGLVGLFTFTILLSTLGAVVPYAFASLAGFLMARREGSTVPFTRRDAIVGGLAFTYTLVAIAGAGFETIFWGFLVMLVGLPLYVWIARGKPV
jgi:APA family basic amino acid/polyamine antiporter